MNNHDEFLKYLRSDWFSVADKVMASKTNRLHDPITREEIASVLENSDEAPPPIVRKLLAQIVRGEFKFRKGVQPRPFAQRQRAVYHFFEMEDAIKAQKGPDAKAKRGETTVRQLALEGIAADYSITTRTLENWLEEYEELILEGYKARGLVFNSYREVRAYEAELLAQAWYGALIRGWPLPPLK